MPVKVREGIDYRVYREPGGQFLLALTCNGISPSGMYDCIDQLSYPEDFEHPTVAGVTVSHDYLNHRCRQAKMSNLTPVWLQAFQPYLEG